MSNLFTLLMIGDNSCSVEMAILNRPNFAVVRNYCRAEVFESLSSILYLFFWVDALLLLDSILAA